MRRKNQRITDDADRVVKDIKRQTRRRFSAEEKIRIVLAGLRGDESIAELCRQEGIAQSQYYSWSKEFMEAGKKRLSGDTGRQATSGEVEDRFVNHGRHSAPTGHSGPSVASRRRPRFQRRHNLVTIAKDLRAVWKCRLQSAKKRSERRRKSWHSIVVYRRWS